MENATIIGSEINKTTNGKIAGTYSTSELQRLISKSSIIEV